MHIVTEHFAFGPVAILIPVVIAIVAAFSIWFGGEAETKLGAAARGVSVGGAVAALLFTGAMMAHTLGTLGNDHGPEPLTDGSYVAHQTTVPKGDVFGYYDITVVNGGVLTHQLIPAADTTIRVGTAPRLDVHTRTIFDKDPWFISFSYTETTYTLTTDGVPPAAFVPAGK